MQRHALGASRANRRIKAIRFGFIRLAGWVIDRAHQLQIRVNAGHSAFCWLARARRKVLSSLHDPGP